MIGDPLSLSEAYVLFSLQMGFRPATSTTWRTEATALMRKGYVVPRILEGSSGLAITDEGAQTIARMLTWSAPSGVGLALGEFRYPFCTCEKDPSGCEVHAS